MVEQRGGECQNSIRVSLWPLSNISTDLTVHFLRFATAYAITKALLPLRIVFSVWATPWFARWTVLPTTRYIRRMFGKKQKHIPSAPTTGVGVTGAGILTTKGSFTKPAPGRAVPNRGK